MRRSEILILDEPTSALTLTRYRTLQGSPELKQNNIIHHHHLAEVFEISTSIGILRDGVMAMRGKVGTLREKILYADFFTDSRIKKEIAERKH